MVKRLRIAVLSRNFSVRGGGAERYAVSVAQHLAARHEVHVFAQNFESVLPEVQYHKVPCPMARPRWINQLYFGWATWKATREGFDVVHSHENTWHGNVQTVHVLPVKHNLFVGRLGFAKALRWLKVSLSPRLWAYLWLEKARYATRGKRCIVLASKSLKDVMVESYPSARAAMSVITPGVDSVPGVCSIAERTSARLVLGLPLEGSGLLFVGNDFHKKGLPALLQAMMVLPMDVWLAVVGDGEQGAAMLQLTVEMGLSQRVHFLGTLQCMDDAYRAANCLVHPTLEDTYAMVVLEAFAHGVPVVVSSAKYCGISAELVSGVHALNLESPHSCQEIAKNVNSILEDPALRQLLSSNAVAFARRHVWESVASEYEQLFERVVQWTKL
jgi:glycosyltransferase involved in cell wall biosynthesis